MSAASFLARLYPPPVRERWGADLRDEVAEGGIRSWPNTFAGAIRLWLHPTDWPEMSPGQTRRVLTSALFGLIAISGVLLRSMEPTTVVTADLRHPLTSAWLLPLVLGAALALPLPSRRLADLRRLTWAAASTLTGPAAAGATVLALAWSGVAENTDGHAHIVLFVFYWLTFALIAFRLFVLIGQVAHTALLPSKRRLQGALACLGAGLGMVAGQSLVAYTQSRSHPFPLQGVVLLIVAGAFVITSVDLRRQKTV